MGSSKVRFGNFYVVGCHEIKKADDLVSHKCYFYGLGGAVVHTAHAGNACAGIHRVDFQIDGFNRAFVDTGSALNALFIIDSMRAD